MSAPESPSLRLDKWLWFARLARSRARAAQLCAAGCIAIGDVTIAKPHHALRCGDWVTIALGRQRRRLKVLSLGARRGPAAEARRLYEEPAPPERIDEPAARWTPLLAEEPDPAALAPAPSLGKDADHD